MAPHPGRKQGAALGDKCLRRPKEGLLARPDESRGAAPAPRKGLPALDPAQGWGKRFIFSVPFGPFRGLTYS